MQRALKSITSFIVSFALAFTGVVPSRAQAQAAPPACFADSTTTSGKNPYCTAVTRGGGSFAYAKLHWEDIGRVSLTVDRMPQLVKVGSASNNLGSAAASMLGLSDADVVDALKVYPNNVPLVFGRYDTLNKSLRVDIFKVERAGQSAVMQHASFTPAHGDYWKAVGAYTSAAVRQAGGLGVNPFSIFTAGDGSGRFDNISLDAALVVVGHAQRLVQAPVSVVATVQTGMDTKVKKWTCGLKKCIRTTYLAKSDTQWYMGMPESQVQASLAVYPRGWCVGQPSQENASCLVQERVTAGVAFQQQQGGTFSSEQVVKELGSEKKSSWGLLALVIFTFVAAAIVAMAAPALLGNVAGLSGAAGGSFGGLGTAIASQLGFNLTGALAIAGAEAATVGTLAVLGGADLSSAVDFNGLYNAETNRAFEQPAAQSDKWARKAQDYARGAVVGSLPSALAPVRRTLIGDCGMQARGAACGTSSQGIVPRADSAVVGDGALTVFREASGQVLRYESQLLGN